jgi:hypothetical protein
VTRLFVDVFNRGCYNIRTSNFLSPRAIIPKKNHRHKHSHVDATIQRYKTTGKHKLTPTFFVIGLYIKISADKTLLFSEKEAKSVVLFYLVETVLCPYLGEADPGGSGGRAPQKKPPIPSLKVRKEVKRVVPVRRCEGKVLIIIQSTINNKTKTGVGNERK